jgi:hypothetical protein
METEETEQKRTSPWGVVLLLILLFVGLLFVIGVTYKPKPYDPKKACEDQYGAGTDAAQRCELQLDMEKLKQMDDDKMSRARQDSGG